MPKNQGEGDYEAARRYNQHTTQHAQQMQEDGSLEKLAEDEGSQSAEELAAARRVGKSHAKAGDADLRDAATFRALREQENEP